MNILNKFYITGKTDKKGSFYWSDINTLQEFFNRFKDKKFLVRFEVIHPELSINFQAYYEKHILPQLQEAYWNNGERYNFEELDEIINQTCPILHEYDFNKKRIINYKKINELSTVEMRELINELVQHCAENLNYIIDE